MLSPKEFAFWPTPEDAEWGLLFCEDEKGKRWTVLGDPAAVRMLIAMSPEARADMEIDNSLFPHKREGWPDEWADPRFDAP